MDSSMMSISGSSMSSMTMGSGMSDMSTTMVTSASPTMTMSGMAMGTSTGMDMPASSSDMVGMMGMDSMAMVFFTSSITPLYSWAWTPNTVGQYAGTCIFLIAFAAIFRALLAMRVRFFDFLALAKHPRSRGRGYTASTDEKPRARPWRANEAVMLGAMDVVLAGVSYLLMIAVMTMNVGYFLSILTGVFIGSMAFGHFTANSAAH